MTPAGAPHSPALRRWLIVADDLTGAADACAKFVAHGFAGSVVPWRPGAAEALSTAGGDAPAAMALSLDTRGATAAVARERIAEVAAHAGRWTGGVFKKIDSTLRGAVGAEVTAASAAFGCSHVILTPAYPAMGRRVRGGRLSVNDVTGEAGLDVERTLVAGGLAMAAASLASPPGSPAGRRARLAAGMSAARARGCRALLFDAASDEDLDAITGTGLASGGHPLWAGSAGLAAALARRIGTRSAVDGPLPRPAAPVAIVIGSPHGVTAEQLAVAAAAFGFAVRDLDGNDPATRKVSPPANLRAFRVNSRHDVITALRATLERVRPGSLILSGGDTAAAACAALDVQAIRIHGEIEEGVPWGTLSGGTADGVTAVLKSGGFGTRHTLAHAITCLLRT